MENTNPSPIYVALGGNLDHPVWGPPRRALEAALAELGRRGIVLRQVSRWYRTAPVPASDQPWFVNAVAEVETDLEADAVLAVLHAVEADFGRVRTVANAARLIDLDLLDYRGVTTPGGPGQATLPHPRMAGRAFVLLPLADLAPAWRHPVTGQPIAALVAALPPGQGIEAT